MFLSLYDNYPASNNDKYLRDEPAIIVLSQPSVETGDPLFPMSQAELDVINSFIVSGEHEEQVSHEWTKLYYHRMFDGPNSQMEYLIQKLQESEVRGEAQISIWDKTVDQVAAISPCTQIIWARIKVGRLELHVHAHSSDAYKKLLMNMQEFIAVQYYIANKLHLQVGKYYHFLDSCHLHSKDRVGIDALINKLR